MKIVFLGDSITDANHLFTVDNLGEGYVKNIAHSFGITDNMQENEYNIKIINRGYDGFTINRMGELIFQVVEEEPDIVSILIGVNDLAGYMQGIRSLSLEVFKEKYTKILDELLKKTNCKIIIMEPFIFEQPEEFKIWKNKMKDYISIINSMKDIFKEFNDRIAYMDSFSRFNEMEKEYGSRYLTIDGIHLTLEGHKMLADWWMETLSTI